MWDIMSTVGCILSTMGVLITMGEFMINVGGYHEYRRGCSVLWGTQITKYFSPHGTEHPHGTHDTPMCIMISPHGTEHPHGTQDISPRYS